LTATVACPRPGKTTEPEAAVTIEGLLEVAGKPPRWVELWPWIAWPAVVVLLFAVRERLVCQRRERGGRRSAVVGSPPLAADRPG
jgi:hypothetical protein